MPDWGKQGILTEDEAELMAKFVQNEPPQPAEMSLEQMASFWNVIVPTDQRPTKPEHDRNWQNFFVVTLRDAGQVAIIDGDTFEIVNTVDTDGEMTIKEGIRSYYDFEDDDDYMFVLKATFNITADADFVDLEKCLFDYD